MNKNERAEAYTILKKKEQLKPFVIGKSEITEDEKKITEMMKKKVKESIKSKQ